MQMDGTCSWIGCELRFLDSLPCLVGQTCWFLGVGMRKRGKPQRFVWNTEGDGYHGGISRASLCWR